MVGKIVFLMGVLVSVTGLAVPREVLHVVYVTNRDRAPLPDYEGRLDRIMVDVQDFFRTEMDRNGYGEKTFKLDLDAEGKTIVHVVTLDEGFDPDRRFGVRQIRPVIAKTMLAKGIDIEEEYIMVFENSYWKNGDMWTYDMVYTGSGNPIKGATWVADHEGLDPDNIHPDRTERINDRRQKLTLARFNVKMIGGVAHEFGHGLGLPHNHETSVEFKALGKALMGAGNYTYRQERIGKNPNGTFLTLPHAFILSLHPLFNGKTPENFDVPNVFPEDLAFASRDGMLQVSGRIDPADEVAGVVLYHDPLPTGVNKDYDAFSSRSETSPSGTFSSAIPLTGKDSAFHLIVYFKNGMFRPFRFDHTKEKALESLRASYRKERVKYAFEKKDVETLKAIIKEVGTDDPELKQQLQKFIGISEQWKKRPVPEKIPISKKKVSLSATRWDAASVGWGAPSVDGILAPGSDTPLPIETKKGEPLKGIYAHAPSRYTYALGGKWVTLKTRIGLQRGKRAGSVIFIVKGDGKELFRSALIQLEDGEIDVRVDVTGIQTLELITETGADRGAEDWGLWIAPTLIRK